MMQTMVRQRTILRLMVMAMVTMVMIAMTMVIVVRLRGGKVAAPKNLCQVSAGEGQKKHLQCGDIVNVQTLFKCAKN